jgi:hypothetical protein
LLDCTGLRKIVVNNGIAFDASHVGASRQRISDLSSAFHQDGINDIEGLMLDVAVPQPLEDWLLSGLGLLQQSLINEATLFDLSQQIGRRAQIGLVG